ncbi:MAG: hypothetical protein DRQ89_14525, partial [Epsilonproteobacteria bacterium]
MKDNKTLFALAILFLLIVDVQGQKQIRSLMEGFPAIIEEIFETEHPEARTLGPGLFGDSEPLREQYSATTNKFAGTVNDSLYIREAKSSTFLLSIEPEEGFYWHIDNALWSPNGRYIVVKQVDDRDVPEIKRTKSNAEKIEYKKYSRAGDKIPIHQFYIVNIDSGSKLAIDQNPNLPYVHVLEWSGRNDKLFLIASDRLMKEVRLQMIDVHTGEATTMLTEKSDTYLIGLDLLQGYSKSLQDLQLATFFDDNEQFTWLSERNGYKQIYLYDYDGDLIRPLTNFAENGIVRDIQEIDQENGWIYFLAHGDQEHPYSPQLYKTNLNSAKIIEVVNAPGILELFFPASKDTLWVLRSTLPRTLQIDRYSPLGVYYDTPWEANYSAIDKNHFNFEYVSATTANGKTKLQALILKPIDFDTNKKYPVVEYIYGANFHNVVPMDLLDKPLWEMNALAHDGFITVFIDGRGTSGRGKVFGDFSYGRFGQVELEDHISVLKQIAMDRPYMNMERIGILGHSWGGHFALRALLEAPDFYKAGHLNAPALEPGEFRVSIEPFMGCLPQDCPDLYAKSGILDKLDQLEAPLMIVHGTYDDDVPIDDSYNLVALLDQLKYENYEFVAYDGMGHVVMRNPEW